jgi:hypothetical protein
MALNLFRSRPGQALFLKQKLCQVMDHDWKGTWKRDTRNKALNVGWRPFSCKNHWPGCEEHVGLSLEDIPRHFFEKKSGVSWRIMVAKASEKETPETRRSTLADGHFRTKVVGRGANDQSGSPLKTFQGTFSKIKFVAEDGSWWQRLVEKRHLKRGAQHWPTDIPVQKSLAAVQMTSRAPHWRPSKALFRKEKWRQLMDHDCKGLWKRDTRNEALNIGWRPFSHESRRPRCKRPVGLPIEDLPRHFFENKICVSWWNIITKACEKETQETRRSTLADGHFRSKSGEIRQKVGCVDLEDHPRPFFFMLKMFIKKQMIA